MNLTIIGTEIIAKLIGDELLKDMDKIVYIDSSPMNFNSWGIKGDDKVQFFQGDFKKIETLSNSRLAESKLLILCTSSDSLNAFIAQKAKINFNVTSVILLKNFDLKQIYSEMGYDVLNYHNIDVKKIKKIISKIE